MIRILHLSDFHYKPTHPEDFEDMGKKIATDVLKRLDNKSLDLIVFSGDLVYTGNKKETFEKAATALFDPIKKLTGLTNEQILLTPGNHDRVFGKELPIVKTGINLCSTQEDLDKFCLAKEQLALSIVDQEEYNAYINEFYSDDWIKKELYTCRKITCNGHQIGLLSLNSSWRCSGESRNDRGKLVFPVYAVKEAFKHLCDTEFIFCTEHHNLSDYCEYIARDIEDELHDKCHILFTGHYHKTSINVNHDSEVGMIHISAPASFNRNDNEVNFGYSIIEFDEDEEKAIVTPYLYTSKQFCETRAVCVNIPVSQEKIKQNTFRKLIRKRYQETLAIADDLFVNHGVGMFLKMFNNPIIKDKSVQEIITSQREGQKYQLADIAYQNKSAIIFGYGKRGKTSLLRKIQLDVLNEITAHKVIPYYINYPLLQNKEIDLQKLLKNFLELNTRDTTERFTKYKLLLLIDDLNPTDSAFMSHLKEEMIKFPNCRFVATSLESMSNQIPLINFFGTDIDKYYIHDVTVREVHQLTLKWPSLEVSRKREIEDKLIQIFNQMHIPLNYWSISLFLWICAKTDNANVHNNFDLIKLYVDELLDVRNYLNTSNFAVTFDDLKSYIGALAVEIMQNDYALSDAELTTFTETYIASHAKFTDNPIDIINYLFEKGILSRDVAGGKISIRLKGVFEYFIAYHMSENSDFREKVLKIKNSFMPFANEWELYAGFCKDDKESFKYLFNSVKEVMSELTSKADYTDIDSRIHQRVIITEANRNATGKLIDRLNTMPENEEFDILPIHDLRQNDTILRPKTYLNKIELISSNIEKMIFVLARIYRNSNICDIEELSNEMFEYIVDGACNLGFMLVNEAKLYADESDEDFVQLVSNCMPIIVEAFFYDAIAQKNLTRVFEDKLQQYMNQPMGNQMRIFMMAMVLMDINAVKYRDNVEKALNVINNNVLRFSILQKTILNSIRDNDNSEIKNALKPIRQLLSGEFYETHNQQNELEMIIHKEKIKQTSIRKTTK